MTKSSDELLASFVELEASRRKNASAVGEGEGPKTEIVKVKKTRRAGWVLDGEDNEEEFEVEEEIPVTEPYDRAATTVRAPVLSSISSDTREKTPQGNYQTLMPGSFPISAPAEKNEAPPRQYQTLAAPPRGLLSWFTGSQQGTSTKEADRESLKQKLKEGNIVDASSILFSIGDPKEILLEFIRKQELKALETYFLIINGEDVPRTLANQLRDAFEAHISEGGNTYIHLAAANGCDELLKFLLTSNLKEQINDQNARNETALLLACKNKHTIAVGLLQEAGAIDDQVLRIVTEKVFQCVDTDVFSMPDFKKAIYDAKKFGFTVDKTNMAGDNLFHIVARRGHDEALAFLLEHEESSEALNAINHANETFLSILIDKDQVDKVEKVDKYTNANVCGEDNLKQLAYAIHAKAFKSVDYFLSKDSEVVDAIGKEKVSALQLVRKMEDKTIREELLRKILAKSQLAVLELETAITKKDKKKVQQLLSEGMSLARVSAVHQKKWREWSVQDRYSITMQQWKKNTNSDHPEIVILNDNIKALQESRKLPLKELDAFITSLYIFRDDLRKEVDGLRTKNKAFDKESDEAINASSAISRVKETAIFVKRLIDAEKDENTVLGTIKQVRLDAVAEFKRRFKRILNWQSYAKAFAVLIASALTFVAAGAAAWFVPPMFAVTIPLYVNVTVPALLALGVFGGGAYAISRRPHLTHQGLNVAAKGQEYVDASLKEAKPVLVC